MTRKPHLIGAAMVGACLMASGASAFAESAGNEHASKAHHLDAQLRQSCGCGNGTEVGSVVPAPPESPTSDQPEDQSITGQVSYVPSGTDELGELPAAPAPTPIRGHHAVTG